MGSEPENLQHSVLVTGATGRIGRALRAIWGTKLASNLPIIWQSRDLTAENDLHWDIGKTPSPPLPMGLIVLHLAGKTSGSLADLDQNAVVTQAVCQAAVDAQARHIVVMSSAAVYAPGPLPLHETDSPGPVNAYGASKLAAEQMAQHVVQGSATRLTILRLANLAGADALLGAAIPGHAVTLDPIAGQCGGPERSYIGPRVLAQVLADLVLQAVQGADLPLVVNLAQQPPVAMADLLQACGQDWRFGPPRAAAVGRVVLNTDRLATLTDLPHTSAAALIADLRSLPGWPR